MQTALAQGSSWVLCQPLPFQPLLRGNWLEAMAGTPPASSLLFHPMLGPGELKKQNNLLQIHVQTRGLCSTAPLAAPILQELDLPVLLHILQQGPPQSN